MTRILIINGPNLNLLGTREIDIYGSTSFEEYHHSLKEKYNQTATIDYTQSNIEGEIIDTLQSARGNYDGVVINAGGYTHTSVAIGDTVAALTSAGVKVIEVHISNILAREEFRHTSYISPKASGTIWGCGMMGYELGVEAILRSAK